MARKVSYRARKVQRNKEQNNTNSEKGSGGMVEVVPKQLKSEPTQTDA